MIEKADFAKKLIELRTKCGLSQSKLADMLFISGQAISKWETMVSLPDIEILFPLSQILGVSVDYLLGSENDNFKNTTNVIGEAVAGYDISDENKNLLTVMSDSLSREYLYKTAKYLENDSLKYKLSIELVSNANNIKNYYKREIDLNTLDKNTLLPFSKQLSNLTLQAINKSDNPIREILQMMKCPVCGKDFEYIKNVEEEYITCGTHKFNINDGVVDFKTLEIHGYTWSSWIRCYDDYKKSYCDEASQIDKNFGVELKKFKPPVILEIGSGSAWLAKQLVRFIDWECTLILTDLSHRILKYDKRYIDETALNSKVKVVYLACDVRNLPFKDNVLPLVVSCGGYEGISYKFFKPFHESYRVLQTDGKMVCNLAIVSDKENRNVRKWIELIQSDKSEDMVSFYNQIYDLKEWNDLLKGFGFSNYTITQIHGEISAPDTNVFPYDCEIARWMAAAFLVATK